jgi:hypothetical protein
LDNLPTIVTFLDVRDPNSVAVLNPQNLSEQLGGGYSFKRVTLQATSDPVQKVIERFLTWLPAKRMEWAKFHSIGGGNLIDQLFWSAFEQPILMDIGQ